MLTSIFPPLPPYEGLHPLVVHYPIALLMTVPVFVVIAAAWKRQTRPMITAALILCVLGVAAAFLAVSTGEATERFAKGIPGADATLHEHEELAEFARNLFTGVAILLAVMTAFAWKIGDKLTARTRWIAAVAFLLVHGYAASVLANAAHQGGKLVHVHGVRAPMASEPVPAGGGGDED